MRISRLLCTLPLLLVCLPHLRPRNRGRGFRVRQSTALLRSVIGAWLQPRGAGPAPSLSGCLHLYNLQQRKSTGRVLTVVARDCVTGLLKQSNTLLVSLDVRIRLAVPLQALLRKLECRLAVGTLEIPGSNSTHVFPQVDVPGHAWVCDRLVVWHIRAAK